MKIRIEIKWAVVFTIATLLWILLEKIVGLHDQYLDYQMYLTTLFAIPAIWIIVLALKDKKTNFFNGQMNYLQGLKSGVVLSAIIALISPFSQWIISYVITPEYFPNVIERSVELGYYNSTEEAAAHFNYKNYAIQSSVGSLLMGIATTSIAMIFLRSKKGISV